MPFASLSIEDDFEVLARSYVDALSAFEIGDIDSKELGAVIASLNPRPSAPKA